MAYCTEGPALDELRRNLMGCERLIDPSKGSEARDFFHEFMEHHEFGLALLTVCDHLLEDGAAALDADQLMRIQSLRKRMQMDDPCFSELEALFATRE